MDAFADPDTSQSSMIQNLVSLPAVIKSYQLSSTGEANVPETAFAYEDPSMVAFEALEPTSGRKRWKMKHHKRIKKKEKPGKNGYQGS